MARYQSPSSRFMPASGTPSAASSPRAWPGVSSCENGGTGRDPRVKCSTCGLWLDMVNLERHECRHSSAHDAAGYSSRKPPLRVDIAKAVAVQTHQQHPYRTLTAAASNDHEATSRQPPNELHQTLPPRGQSRVA
ncbi:hypothetical protein ACM66B_001432 [Microbotryomycetes sp. NB124-2]